MFLKVIELINKVIYDCVFSVIEIVYKCYVYKFVVILWKIKLI